MDNLELFYFIFNFSQKSAILDNLMIFITTYVIYLSLLLVFILGIKGKIKEKKSLLIIILAIPIAVFLIKGIHLFINEPRPFVSFNFLPLTDNNPNDSFPSRHGTIMAVIAFTYTYFKSKWAAIFLILMLLVGTSRIYVGVHYPLDVLGGFAVGAWSVAISIFSVNLFKAKI